MTDTNHIQALHAAISRRDWHAVEVAANAIRDTAPAPSHVQAPCARKAATRECIAIVEDERSDNCDRDIAAMLSALLTSPAPQIDEAMVERFKVAFQNPPDDKRVRDFTYDENVARGLQAAIGGGKP